ncbi:MAG TPA: L-threonylcarbamoyladenylate synthase [Cytophagaceae bacterium]|jgi:tRNA threonylcarbamoyl adenosine modification protein (Sua5/YciO/YrdC/YwlC family)|nr:L-threonylcarbamoyladenylate synthase [Cytophagaceae bacterium]
MSAEFIDIHPQNPQPVRINRVIETVRKGGIIIYPTDTVYGIGCDIRNTRAVERLCKIQNLDPKKINLSFICYDLSHISEYTRNLPTSVFKIMKKTLPGPYTFLLNANNNVPKILHTKKNTVGIRVPNHSIPRLIVKESGNPLLNSSIKDADTLIEYTTDPEEIFDRYKHFVDIVINAGFGGNIPSTILDCTNEDIEIVREGLGGLDGLL